MRQLKKTNLFFSLLAFFFYASLVAVNRAFKPYSAANHPVYFAPPQSIKHFSFGFAEVYGDILWLRLIQDMDFCSSAKGKPVYKGNSKYQCQEGWSYKMTDALTELTPRFFSPYLTASSVMSVIMGDKMGAKKIYDKGVKRFPKRWNLLFHAGYHYLWELKDEKRGTELLLQSARNGGPKWLYSLAAKKYKKTGKLLLAREILQEFMEKDTKGEYQKIIKEKLKEIETEIKQLNPGISKVWFRAFRPTIKFSWRSGTSRGFLLDQPACLDGQFYPTAATLFSVYLMPLSALYNLQGIS